MGEFNKIEEVMFELEDYISVGEAVKLTGISKPTLIAWGSKYHIGRKIGGRWFLHQEKLANLLRGIQRRDG